MATYNYNQPIGIQKQYSDDIRGISGDFWAIEVIQQKFDENTPTNPLVPKTMSVTMLLFKDESYYGDPTKLSTEVRRTYQVQYFVYNYGKVEGMEQQDLTLLMLNKLVADPNNVEVYQGTIITYPIVIIENELI